MDATRSTAIGLCQNARTAWQLSSGKTVFLRGSMDSFLGGSDRCASPGLTSSSAVGPATGGVRAGLRPSVLELLSESLSGSAT